MESWKDIQGVGVISLITISNSRDFACCPTSPLCFWQAWGGSLHTCTPDVLVWILILLYYHSRSIEERCVIANHSCRDTTANQKALPLKHWPDLYLDS